MSQSIEEIKKHYPDEWLLLGDPVMSEDGQRMVAADLLYHSPNKRELAYMDKPLLKEYKRNALLFNYVTIRKKSFLVGGRTLSSSNPIKSEY